MKLVAETNRLLKRGSVWYYVRRVPIHLEPLVGKSVVKRSLGTGNLAEAKKRRSLHDLSTDAMFAKLEAQALDADTAHTMHAPSVSELTEYVRLELQANDKRLATALIVDPPESADQLHEMRMEAETMLAVLADPDDPRRYETIYAFKKRALAHAGKPPGMDSVELTDAVRRALVELYRRTLDRYDDRYDVPFHDPMFEPNKFNKTTMAELAESYLVEKDEEFAANNVSKQRSSTIAAHVAVILEIVGPSVHVCDLGDADVQRLRSALGRIPKNKSKLYPDLSVDEAIERAQAEKRPPLSPTTQGFYLETFKRLVRLAVRRKLLSNDIAADVKTIKKNTVSADQRRLPLKPAQLISFFESEFYKCCAPGASPQYTKTDRPWRFWMPLIMLFSGARPNEIAQLRVLDIKVTTAGTAYFDFLGDVEEDGSEEKLKVKTESSKRRIPIHAELLKMGFMSFVAAARKARGESGRLYPTLTPNKNGNIAWYATRRFSEHFLPAVTKLGARQSFYSLRHNVRDALRDVAAPADALLAIAGWSAGGKVVSDHYGDTTNPDKYRAWVDAIKYPDLNLDFLHVPS